MTKRCLKCAGTLKVVKTITALDTPIRTEKLQKLKCDTCGRSACAAVTFELDMDCSDYYYPQ